MQHLFVDKKNFESTKWLNFKHEKVQEENVAAKYIVTFP